MGFWSLDEWKKPPPPVTGDRHEHVRIISPNNRDSHDRHFHLLPLYFQNMHFRSSQTPLLRTHAKSFSFREHLLCARQALYTIIALTTIPPGLRNGLPEDKRLAQGRIRAQRWRGTNGRSPRRPELARRA